MNTKIDLKSALCGLAVGVLAMLAIGAATPSNAIGRYQVSGGSSVCTILDTTTGRAWAASLSTITGTQTGFWEPKIDQ